MDRPSDNPNIPLFWDMMREFGAKAPGKLTGFMETPVDWHCHGCLRDKRAIARLDKNGNLLCRVVLHHDHFDEEYFPSELVKVLGYPAADAARRHIRRFEPQIICEDCNTADSAAKAVLGAPTGFSFAPHEIGRFIDVTPNQPHKVDPDRARSVYIEVQPVMSRLAQVLRAAKTMNKQIGDWEPVRDPLLRAMAVKRENGKD